ncbi:MAG: YkgJ family cysteine cluster protein [Thermodesulfobacteriota bacterium]
MIEAASRSCPHTEVGVSIERKRAILARLYRRFDEVCADFALACRQQCRICCTQNVVATTAEVEFMLHHAGETDRDMLTQKALHKADYVRFRPRLTPNALAAFCIERRDPPPEDEVLPGSACPFRDERGCSVYESRPFACRSMISTQLCEAGGEAFVPPAVVSISSAFCQIIEDVDGGGLYGNMLDILAVFRDESALTAYRKARPWAVAALLPPTMPNPGLLVPPEHQDQVMAAVTLLGGM